MTKSVITITDPDSSKSVPVANVSPCSHVHLVSLNLGRRGEVSHNLHPEEESLLGIT